MAGELKRRGVEVGVVQGVARRCPLPINRGTTTHSQRWIAAMQTAEESLMEGRSGIEVVLSDRSILDVLAYQLVANKMDPVLQGVAEQWVRTYDVLFRMEPRDEFYMDDGVRDMDKRFRQQVHRKLDGLLRSNMVTEVVEVEWFESVEAAVSLLENYK